MWCTAPPRCFGAIASTLHYSTAQQHYIQVTSHSSLMVALSCGRLNSHGSLLLLQLSTVERDQAIIGITSKYRCHRYANRAAMRFWCQLKSIHGVFTVQQTG
jgi:hypothetical protein